MASGDTVHDVSKVPSVEQAIADVGVDSGSSNIALVEDQSSYIGCDHSICVKQVWC